MRGRQRTPSIATQGNSQICYKTQYKASDLVRNEFILSAGGANRYDVGGSGRHADEVGLQVDSLRSDGGYWRRRLERGGRYTAW